MGPSAGAARGLGSHAGLGMGHCAPRAFCQSKSFRESSMTRSGWASARLVVSPGSAARLKSSGRPVFVDRDEFPVAGADGGIGGGAAWMVMGIVPVKRVPIEATAGRCGGIFEKGHKADAVEAARSDVVLRETGGFEECRMEVDAHDRLGAGASGMVTPGHFTRSGTRWPPS